MVRRLVAVSVLVLVVSVAGVAAAGPSLAGCSEHFPEAEWSPAGETDLLTVETAGLSPGQALRFAEEASITARWLDTDLGGLEPLTLCVTGRDVVLDGAGIVAEGQRLHSVVFNDDGTVVVDALEALFFDEAHAFGLAYAALWQVAAQIGTEGYPEPLATTIAQWYLSRAADKLELHHAQMRSGAFFNDPSGRGVATTEWTASAQPATYAWNPQFQESPLADFVEFAVASEGPAILRDPSGERWAALEQEWQAALREEALQGSTGGNAWVVGLGIALGMVALAGLLAWLNHLSKRRTTEAARSRALETAGVAPGGPGDHEDH